MLDHITQSAAPMERAVRLGSGANDAIAHVLQQVRTRRGYQQMGAGNNIRQNKIESFDPIIPSTS